MHWVTGKILLINAILCLKILMFLIKIKKNLNKLAKKLLEKEMSIKILRGLRLKKFDVLVGINLLREGLDLPEVSMIAVLDADKEGFLRSKSSLMQVSGWAARNTNGRVILYGDKTGFAKASAFDRINVRRLFIFLEDAISAAAKDQLFEFNDEITRTNFVNIVEPFLRDVQAKRWIQDYVVICDETNNTAAIIDANEFIADIYIKPARAINFIGLNFIATRTGVSFEEVIGNV